MAKKKAQTVGYKYFASGHFVLCHGPVDAITRISFQEKDAYLNEESINKTIYVDKPSLFGGDEQQGGVQGNIDLLFGRSDQTKNSTLSSICGGIISAWRGVTSIVFNNVYIGTSPSMPESKWRVKRIHTRHLGETQWYDAKAEIFPPPASDNPAYNFAQLNWEMVGKNGASGNSNIPTGNFGTSSFVIQSPNFSADTVFEIDLGVTASTEMREVVGGQQVGDYSWVRKGGSYAASSFNRYMIQISNPAETYYFNHGTSSDPYDDSERFAKIKIQVKNGATVTCICDPVDNYMARGSTLGFHQYMRFDAANGLNRDINPAHIIRECLTNRIWGKGAAETSIDDVSFQAAADTLYAENMGMSSKWTDSTPIDDFVKNVRQHINAELYVNRFTGKWTLKLIRADYVKAGLPLLNESNIRDLSFERKSLAECINQVTVTYWDRERGKDSTVTVQDIARIAQQGGVVSQTVDYKGFTNSDIAGRVALRDLKTLSDTLATIDFKTAENFVSDWHKGKAFKLSYADYGLSEAVFRVTEIEFGNGIDNTISITAVEDSFSSPMQSIVEYVPPVTSDTSAKAAECIAFEVPYLELVQQYGQSEIDTKLTNNPTLAYVGMAAARPNNYHINASLFVDSGAGYAEESTLDFCPNMTLKTDIGYLDSAFEVQNIAEISNAVSGQWLQVDAEIMVFVSFDAATNIVTVKRGALDTVPAKHTAGARLYIWDALSGLDGTDYLSGEVINLKALTNTGSDILALSSATAKTVTCIGRAYRPYPPANVKIGGVYYPTDVTASIVLTWVDRNRVQQTGGTILGYFDAGVTVESGVTYKLIVYAIDASNVQTEFFNQNVGAVNTYTVDLSTAPATAVKFRILLKSVRNTYESYQSFDYTLNASFTAPYNITYSVVTV